MNTGTDDALLRVQDLQVEFSSRRGRALVLNGVNLEIRAGQTLCVVGESGCGKSMTALALLRLIPTPPGRISGGCVLFQGEDLVQASQARMRQLRGNRISMIFQEPMTSLNPVFTVGAQIGEALQLHAAMTARAARQHSIEMLRQVGIAAPGRRVDAYPHQLSGGMRQRVMIAMALACRPDILIADEPTTALDVTVQAQIFELLRALQRDKGSAILLITHDMGVVAEMADRVAVMYAGRVIEQGSAQQLLANPAHPYTRGLIDCLPRLGSSVARGAGNAGAGGAGDDGSAGGDRRLRAKNLTEIAGMVPSIWELGSGCAFRQRCPRALARCALEVPPMFAPAPALAASAHGAACWLHAGAAGAPALQPGQEQQA